MKYAKQFIIAVAGIFFMISCQKELSLETGSIGGIAQGTLKDSLGDCQPITIRGPYFADSLLTDSNFVLVQINVASPGRYTISTDNQNGYSFTDTGFVTIPGLQQIRLKAKGRPILAVVSDFTVTFGSSFCVFSISVLPKATGPAALFTLSGTANNCTNAVVSGSYFTGVTLNTTNIVNIQVNVTTRGPYTISTTQTNGITFTRSGTFTNTGIQTVNLQGSGTPVAVGASVIPVTAGSSNCNFTVNITAPPIVNLNDSDTAWQFTQGSTNFRGTFDSVAFSKPATSPFFILQMIGLTSATGDTAMILGIAMPGSTIQSGTYNTTTLAGFSFQDINVNPNVVIYSADPLITTPVVNISVVLNYNTTTKVASGTFTGTAKNAANAAVPITLGKFRAQVP